MKRFALTGIFVGYLLAATIQTVFMIDPKTRKWYIVAGGFTVSGSFLLMIIVNLMGWEFMIIAWLFIIAGFGSVYAITYLFIFVNENLKGELASFLYIILNLFWGVAGIFFTILGYVSQCDWRVMMAVCALMMSICSIYMIYWKKDEKHEEGDQIIQENISIISYFKDMWPNKTIRTNFLIYVLLWGFFHIVYNVQYVELESVGGSVYFNTILCCFIEIFSSFFAGFISRKYSCDKVLKMVISLVVLCFSCFIFAPLSLSQASGIKVTFFVTCLLISKISNDLINLLIYISLVKMFTDKYTGFFVIISRSFARLMLIFLPTVNYIIRMLQIHPFVFYAFCYAMCRFLLIYCHEVQSEAGIDQLMNEVNLGNMERISVISGSHSMAGSIEHENILKNIKVEGIQLSFIQKYKQNPGSVKLDHNINANILKNIHCSKSWNEKRSSCNDLKEGLLKQRNENEVEMTRVVAKSGIFT